MQETFIVFLSNISSLPLCCYFFQKNIYKLCPVDRLLHHQKMVILEDCGKVSMNLGISPSSSNSHLPVFTSIFHLEIKF